MSISKLLAQAIAPFSQDMQTPKNLEETEVVLKKHQLKKRRTIDQLQIDQLTSEGLKINKLIKQESEERYIVCVSVCFCDCNKYGIYGGKYIQGGCILLWQLM